MNLRNLCNSLMNMHPGIRFVGVLDNNAKLIEGGMKKNIPSLLPAGKDDLFYLRALSHLKELKDFKDSLGDVKYTFIQMDKISFVTMSLKEEDEEEKEEGNNDVITLLVSMEPDVNPSFIIPSIRNLVIE
jgi:hypothetical protein